MRGRFTPQAQQDLIEIASVVALDKQHRALTFISQNERNCSSLTGLPERFPVVLAEHAYPGRKLTFRHDVSFYRTEPDKLVILRIVHGAKVTDEFLDVFS